MSRVTYANVMSSFAVIMALGGTAYATHKVTGPEVKNGTLTGVDVQNNSLTRKDVRAITGGDVKNGSLRPHDFREGELPAGPRGPQGEQGDKGDPGEPATRLFATVSSAGALRSGTATAATTGGGAYEVTFAQPVNNCSVIGTGGANGLGYESARSVEVWAEAGVALNGSLDPNKVRVFTFDGAGGTAFEASPFSIAVFC